MISDRKQRQESVIIGLVDTGIWSESENFNDEGLGPIPSSWKGSCEFDIGMCNNKLVGANIFSYGIQQFGGILESPRDELGHGTHTASTAIGTAVPEANSYGFTNGVARGIATNARVAMYKTCYPSGCVKSDIQPAINSAIADGVHILSLSIGQADTPHYENAISLRAFGAMGSDIFIAYSAGNSSPNPYTVENTAPWITNVGTGSIDRSFLVQIMFGNSQTYTGSSLYNTLIGHNQFAPLIYFGDCLYTNTINQDNKKKSGMYWQ